MGKREYKKFLDFMNGQTVMMLEKQQTGYYRTDLERFLWDTNDRTLYD